MKQTVRIIKDDDGPHLIIKFDLFAIGFILISAI